MCYADRQMYISTLHVSLKIGCRSQNLQRVGITATVQKGWSRIMAQGFISESLAAFAANEPSDGLTS